MTAEPAASQFEKIPKAVVVDDTEGVVVAVGVTVADAVLLREKDGVPDGERVMLRVPDGERVMLRVPDGERVLL
jgi:hypothetical protein